MASVEGSVLPFLGLPTPLWAFGKGHFSAAPRAAGGERLIPGSSSNSSLHCAWAFSTGRNVSHPESVLRASGAERVDTARICGGPNGFSGFLQNDAGPPLAISLRHTHIPVRGWLPDRGEQTEERKDGVLPPPRTWLQLVIQEGQPRPAPKPGPPG